MRSRALRYGTECALGYLDLLEHVLVVRTGMGLARAGEGLTQVQTILSSRKPLIELFHLVLLQHRGASGVWKELQVNPGEPSSLVAPKRLD